jgi:hypothetical protein
VLDRIVAARSAHDRFPPCFLERAVSDLLTDGTLAAQIRANADVQAWLLSETRIQRSRVDGFILGFAGHDMHELTAAASRLGNATRSFLAKRA